VTGGLALCGSAGTTALERSHWRWIAPQWQVPPQQVCREGTARWYPAGSPGPEALPGPAEDAARAVLPLRQRGAPLGVALVCWPERQPLHEDVRRRVLELTEVLGRLIPVSPRDESPPYERWPMMHALLDLLAHPGMVLYGRPEERQLQVEHLNPAARSVAAPLPRPAGRPLAQLFPFCAAELSEMVRGAHLAGAPRRVPRLPAEHRGTEQAPLLNVRVLPVAEERCVVLWHISSRDHTFSLLRSAGQLGGLAAFEEDLTRGTVHWTEQSHTLLEVPSGAPPQPLHALAERLPAEDRERLLALLEAITERQESAVAVVRLPRGEGGIRHLRIVAEPLLTHGTLTGITGIFHDVSIQHQTEAALEATLDRLTSVQEQAALRHQLALRLQQAITPELPELQKLVGLEVAARYRPAAQEYRVGGDWYDALRLPGNRTLLTVGDVAGHGIEASTGMVALRNALRGLAYATEEPSRLMHWLNEVALNTAGRPSATAICAVYDPERRSLRWTSAGHLPPLLLRDGKALLVEDRHDLLLGAKSDVAYRETGTELQAGDRLLLYTDGLIERRHASLDQVLAGLRQAAEGLGEAEDAGDLDRQADRLITELSGDTDDDASLMLVRIL
jgi:serine phosphatase RsbU (regulator of sigma subunit)